MVIQSRNICRMITPGAAHTAWLLTLLPTGVDLCVRLLPSVKLSGRREIRNAHEADSDDLNRGNGKCARGAWNSGRATQGSAGRTGKTAPQVRNTGGDPDVGTS